MDSKIAGGPVGVSTARGPRTDNQDCALSMAKLGVYAVADGMGGLADGFVAARTAVTCVRDCAEALVADLRRAKSGEGETTADRLERLIWDANDAVRLDAVTRYAPSRPPRSGCTLTVVVFVDDSLFVAHVGDTRAYVVRGEDVILLTEDHSVAAARVRRGRMSAADALRSGLRNKLYQAVGISDELVVDIVEFVVQPGDRIVVCSDGLWERLTVSQLQEVVGKYPPHESSGELVRVAQQRGLLDNTTVVVIDPQRRSSAVDKAAVLGATSLLRGVPSHELRRLVPYFTLRMVGAGDVLVSQDAPSAALHILGDGAVEMTRDGAPGRTLRAPGQCGIVNFLLGHPPEESVTAVEPGWVMELRPERVAELTRRRPELAAELAFRLAQSLARRAISPSGGG